VSVADRLPVPPLVRVVEFVGVGAVGLAVDLAVTFAALASLDPLLANVAGFAVAVSHNFVGNWWLTFDRPEGSIARQYVGYVAIHSVTFGLRVGVVAAVLAATPLPATVATVLGIGAAVAANYAGSAWVFAPDDPTTGEGQEVHDA
jgi:dolichol-phosphate mannosyltransferase